MSTWVKNIKNQDEVNAILQARLEQKRLKEREWHKANRDKANAYKRKARQNKSKTKKAVLVNTEVFKVVKCTYRANWKEAPVYYCPELTYRRPATDRGM